MRKLALLLAAALVVSAPMLAATATDTYAAAKKKAPAKPAPKAATVDPVTANNAFLRAVADLGASLSRPRAAAAAPAPAKPARTKKAKG